jgi:hypothetical protein
MNCDTVNCHADDDIAEDTKKELATQRYNRKVYEQHASNKTRQRATCNEQIRSLQPGHALAILDFKANLKVNQHYVQLNHEFYQQHSRSLLGLTLVLPNQVSKDLNIHEYVYFDILSDNLNHNAHFVITALKAVFDHDFVKNLNLNKITFWMDGVAHFKNGHIAKYLSDVELTTGMDISWNHFGEYHGKSLCDSRFSSITQFIKMELQSRFGSIETTDDLIRVISSGQEKSNNAVRLGREERPIKSIQMAIDIPDVTEIDNYVIKNIKTFYSFKSKEGVISCSVYSADSAEVVQKRKIETCGNINSITQRLSDTVIRHRYSV